MQKKVEDYTDEEMLDLRYAWVPRGGMPSDAPSDAAWIALMRANPKSFYELLAGIAVLNAAPKVVREALLGKARTSFAVAKSRVH